MQGKIVFEGKSNKGTKLLIRYPAKNDALIMRDYINTLSQERTFIRFQGEKVTLEEETKYLNGQLKKIEEYKALVLLAFSVDKLIGISGIDMKDKTS